MSVAGYLGEKPGELRLRAGDVPCARMEAQVLEGKLSVEEALAVAARRAWRRGRGVWEPGAVRSGAAFALPVGWRGFDF